MLVKHITGLTDADLISNQDLILTDNQTNLLNAMVSERLSGRPISKIIGRKEFYGRDFIVNDDVLDPRPDSETLIEVVLGHATSRNKDFKILDMGTGSGCLILTLLSELPNATGIAADISPSALEIARQNAGKLGVHARVQFIESDWLESIKGQFDIIISNPPYIESKDIDGLDITVSKYDPILALDGGDDGLHPYKVILPQIRNHLKQNGFLAMEHGVGQSQSIMEIARNSGLSDVQTHDDLGGRDRVISAINK